MNAPFKQDARMGDLTTVLGGDTLVLLRMVTDEHINDLFTIKVEALSQDDNIDFDALIGTHATVTLKSFSNPEVPFDGIVTEATFAGLHENGWRYELTLRPWFWLAGRRRNQRIYHNKTVVEILDELLAPYSALGKPAVTKRLTESYPTLEYTVQYRESDLAFATRLMERFGITYHFEHSDGNHALVMTDVMTAHEPLPGASRKFQMTSEGHRADEEHFWDMRPTRRMTTGGIRLTDYNFKMPNAAMEVDRMGDAAYAEGQIESYDYPGDYLEAGRGKDVARLRTLQERGQDHRHRAIGDCASLRAGLTVRVSGDKVKDVIDPCLCLSAQHTYATAAYATGQGSEEPTYEGSYVLLPVSAPLAPERKTHIPKVQGPQTAVVVGEGEIDCDEYGRILVHFHWDLDKRYSMRCRVSQNWAGKGWGGMVIPRIGMEVVVEFLEGDPDKPLVTGCVYNGKNDVPYELPEHKTRSTFKTDTHQGSGFNELRFEDENDKEEIYMHAQKDRNSVIENDDTTLIGRNQVSRVKGGVMSDIDKSAFANIDGSFYLDVGSEHKSSSTKYARSLDGLEINAFSYGFEDQFMKTRDKGEIAVTNGGNVLLNAGDNIVLNAGKDFQLFSRKSTEIQSSAHLRMSASMGAVLSSQKFLKLKANGRLTIGNGKSYITLHEDGAIEITGKSINITVNDTADVNAKRINLN